MSNTVPNGGLLRVAPGSAVQAGSGLVTLSWGGLPVLMIDEEGRMEIGEPFKGNGPEFFIAVSKCLRDCILSERGRAEQAEAELARLKHLMH